VNTPSIKSSFSLRGETIMLEIALWAWAIGASIAVLALAKAAARPTPKWRNQVNEIEKRRMGVNSKGWRHVSVSSAVGFDGRPGGVAVGPASDLPSDFRQTCSHPLQKSLWPV
jgi:hypothetical protein